MADWWWCAAVASSWCASAVAHSVIFAIWMALSVLPFHPWPGSPPKANACVPLHSHDVVHRP
eukprot:3412534-Prymnesium_polylepis.2